MTTLQQARAEYELSKYLQLFCSDEAQFLAGQAALRDSLNGHIEVNIMRLGMYGLFLVLNDAKRLHFIAGGHRADADDKFSRIDFDHGNGTWLYDEEADRLIWISLFQEIIAVNAFGSGLGDERVFSIPDLRRNPRTANLSAVTEPVSLLFFAGVPLTSKNGYDVGAICVVDRNERPALSIAETDLLADTAQRCMALLELARTGCFHNRWTAVQEELDTFLRSRSLHAQLLEESQTSTGLKSSRQKNAMEGAKEDGAGRVDPDTLAEMPLPELGDPPVEGEESQRLVDAETERDHRIAARDNARDARSLTARGSQDDERGLPKGETAYRKVFRRAAECLRSALEADGVLFIDGLIGFHGEIQPVVEPEQELQREIASLSVKDKKFAKSGQAGTSDDIYNSCSPDPSGTHTRLYTSAEYLKGVYVDRPAEVLGLSGSREDLELVRVSESTLGLSYMDEGFLQRLMDRHPNGALWHSSTSSFMQVKDETLVEIDLEEEARMLALGFRNVRQLIFKPLTDPTSRKRLGACIAWRNKSIPIFTDAVDLGSLKMFLHVVESEIARYDASFAVKQQETFVSSVSHELRTPLHGILGAVQLLDESGLSPRQSELAGIIKTCGSTLHETLTSVLSYAKINQFERRQHEYRQRHPPDIVWALTDKQGLASGPDRDFEGLYICTNLAMLCEETLNVLEAGKSFHNPHLSEVIVVCNIGHEENWIYCTEPGAFRRIAVNLIDNALKYTKSGSIIVTLSAAEMIKDSSRVSNDLTSGRTLTLTVQDTGRGMSKDFMDNQLFLPFTQEDSTSTHGVGLGMSIVKSLVSLLGGEIEVQSEENNGTEIKVRVPMRMCTPDDDEKGHAAVQFERDIQTIRNRKLSAVIYGFPKCVRESLTHYLCDWYDCTLLEPTIDARPNIILVDEGNEGLQEAVKRTAHEYSKHGVLLSIVTAPSRLGEGMEIIDEYIKWERLPRPFGPNSIAKGLLSCLEKLDELRKYGENARVDRQATEKPQPQKEPVNLPKLKESLPGEQYLPNLEKLQISKALQASSSPSKPPDTSPNLSKPPAKEEQLNAARERPSESDNQKVEPKLESAPALRILIVDDNALNLRLLVAFFKKNSNRDVKQAKDGREAIEAVQSSSQGFDIIFMDLSMPVMDGFEATRQIREIENGDKSAPAAKESVIIALTGLASQKDENEAFNAGVDLFLTKPVQFSKLSNLLRRYEEGSLRRRIRS